MGEYKVMDDCGEVTYTKPEHVTFCREAEDFGLSVELYHGRGFWYGPAVRVEGVGEFQDAIRATTVRLQWDSCGRDGYILYPVVSDSGLKDAYEGKGEEH